MGVTLVTGVLIGNVTTSEFSGHIGIITGINTSSDENNIDVKVISRVSSAGTVTDVDYAKSDKTRSFQSKALFFNNSSGVGTKHTINSGTVLTGTINNNSHQILNLLEHHRGKPVDSNYSDQRSGGGDAYPRWLLMTTAVTGIQGNILESTFLSKYKDGCDGNTY